MPSPHRLSVLLGRIEAEFLGKLHRKNGESRIVRRIAGQDSANGPVGLHPQDEYGGGRHALDVVGERDQRCCERAGRGVEAIVIQIVAIVELLALTGGANRRRGGWRRRDGLPLDRNARGAASVHSHRRLVIFVAPSRSRLPVWRPEELPSSC